MKTIEIRKTSSPTPILLVKYCDTFLSRFRGLMFTQELDRDRGIIIVEKNESKVNTAIHMMFMKYDIAVLWLNKEMKIVDKVLAKRWALSYVPKQPAQYVVELHHSRLEDFSIGDTLMFE